MGKSPDELFRWLRDDLVELLARRAGGHLHKKLGTTSGNAATAARTRRDSDEHDAQRITATQRGADQAGPTPSTDTPDLSRVPSIRDLLRISPAACRRQPAHRTAQRPGRPVRHVPVG